MNTYEIVERYDDEWEVVATYQAHDARDAVNQHVRSDDDWSDHFDVDVRCDGEITRYGVRLEYVRNVYVDSKGEVKR